MRTTDYEALARELVETRGVLRRLGVGELADRMTMGELGALRLLLQNDDGAHPKELSERLGVSTARVAALLVRLEGQGLLVRSPDATDNRQTVVTLTEQGADRIRERWDQALGRIADLLSRLGPEDAAAYVRIQKRLASYMAEAAPSER